MKKALYLQLTDEEEAALQAGQRVAEDIAARYEKEAGEKLTMAMELSRDYTGKWNAWWKIHHGYEWKLSGHDRSLRAALTEMARTTDAEVKRRRAIDLRQRAAELEKEAAELAANDA